MLISALCDYYKILQQKGRILPDGYSRVGISYLICLTPEGRIADIIDCRVTDTSVKKPLSRPQEMLFPKRTDKTGIGENFIEHRPIYIFGLMYDKVSDTLTAVDKTNKAQKSHEVFVRYNLAEINGIDEPLVNAYRTFLETWQPAAERENPLLLPIRNLIGSGAYFAFCEDGNPAKLLQDVPAIKARWDAHLGQTEDTVVKGQCAITGEYLAMARLHEKIMGIPGGQASGTALVSFNNEAEASYGATQSYNSNISNTAMHMYTEALNYLLRSPKNKTVFDDMTVLHWAASPDDRLDDLFDNCMEGADEVTETLDKLLKSAREGIQQTDMSALLENMDPSVSFYTVGLKPNASRLAVKFIYRNTFADVLLNIAQHMEDMRLSSSTHPVPLWLIKKQLISPKSSSKSTSKSDKEAVDTALMSQLLRAVLNGTMYPDVLLFTLVRRVMTDSDEDIGPHSLAVRMRMIKACINRSARLNGQKEVIPMALDRTNENPAYQCGRLFAVLECIQQKASNYNLNRTIKDAYFASASVRPAVIFPKLITLSQYHLAKLEKSYYDDQEIADILACLGNEFPSILSLKEQGVFMLGYYQQKTDTQQRIKQYKEEK